MRGRLAVLFCGFAIVASVVASCFVDRKTDRYECNTSETCPNGRRCESGYCVVGTIDAAIPIDARIPDARPDAAIPDAPPDAPACPPGCTSCNVTLKTCTMTCDQANECGNLSCPTGYACTINCTAGSACDAIDCVSGTSCDITCAGTNACGNITCGTGACDVACLTTSSCAAIDCDNSCQCDVACNTGNCGTRACPIAGGSACTVDQMPGTNCSSTRTGCETCP